MLGQIPEVLLEQIISFLSIDDWAKIDSLLFNHDIRVKFHSALKSMLLEEISTKEWLWNQRTKNSALQWIIARGINVRSVVVQTNTQVSLSEIEFPGLVSIDISDKQFTDAEIRDLSNSRCNLQSLKIRNCKELTALLRGRSCVQLLMLDINQTIEITDIEIQAISELRHLNHLNISYCGGITDEGALTISQGLPHLTYLNTLGCHLTDEGVKSLVEGLPQIQHFVFGGEMISDEGISFVLIGFSELKSLVVRCDDMRTITEIGLNAFVHTSSSSLQELALDGFQLTDELARSIATGLSKLRSLSIAHCEFDSEILMLILEGLSDLESLDMTCSGIMENDLELIADACSDNRISKITSLNVSWNEQISDAGLASIGRLRSLQSLNISPNILACSISNVGVLALMEGLADSLQVLDVSNADFFNDDGMLCLASRLRKLQTLDMSCCHFVTHAGFAALANGNLPELQSISMKSCSLTDEGLWSIATSSGLTKLQSLHVNDCRQITDKGVAAVIARRKLIIYK